MFSAVPHCSLREDNWRGYYLPKGTLVLPNQGWEDYSYYAYHIIEPPFRFMLNDPRIWGKDAHLFRPERFIETPASELPDMETLVYGFGRRLVTPCFLSEV
jgi:hypothetical protein